jgi:hypothetical protein
MRFPLKPHFFPKSSIRFPFCRQYAREIRQSGGRAIPEETTRLSITR